MASHQRQGSTGGRGGPVGAAEVPAPRGANDCLMLKSAEPPAPWSVAYYDGSGNGYRFWKAAKREGARFEYTPTRPEQSSSGVYSGGSPRKGALDPDRAAELWRRLRKLEADPALRAPARAMGTGAFEVREAKGAPRKFLIKGGVPLREFDGFLAAFRR